MRKTTYAASVTFEHDTLPIKTAKTEVTGGSPAACTAQAVRFAKRTHPGARWTSLVVLLIKKAPDGPLAGGKGQSS